VRKTIIYELEPGRQATGVLQLLWFWFFLSIFFGFSSQYVKKDSIGHLDALMGTRIDSYPVVPAHDLLDGSICRKFALQPQDLGTNLPQTGGYDGSMLNGLNILPSYTDYFNLNPATTGLNTASVFIGGILGPVVSGVISDRLGRRPAIFWGSVITLIGVLLQTAAQNIAMFVVARIVLGFGSALSGIASGAYLSETFPSRWRAWGVGLLNNFYYVGALIAAGITLGTGQWQSTWAWRLPSLFQGIFSVICIIILPFIPESPRWLAHEDYLEVSRTVVAQTNSNGDILDPVAVAVYKEIIDTIAWEKQEGRTMSPKEIVKTPVARKRLLIGMSAGPFSCIAGNIIASYYLGPELDTAGITDPNDQLKAVSLSLLSEPKNVY
jgi:MFS family permease